MIKYSKGYKYQLEENYTLMTPIKGVMVMNDYFELYEDGLLIVLKGYAWDGASGLTRDTPSSMRPSMVHDVFCQCMRAGWVSYDKWQDTVNDFFRQLCIEDGMWKSRAAAWHAAVEFADCGNPKQGIDRQILTAP